MVESTDNNFSQLSSSINQQLNDNDYESHKIFAGGLKKSTTEEELKNYFQNFGEVTETEIVTDRNTGRSRGFAFISFSSKESVRTVLMQTHKIDGIKIDVKLAVKKEKSKILAPKTDQTKRIFVGGVSEKITETYFRDYFSRYGPVTSYNYVINKETNKPKGYGFVIYQSMDDATKALGPHTSLGSNCEAKFADPKSSNKSESSMDGFDYSAYYYAQANLLYSQYLSQMYNGGYYSNQQKHEEENERKKRSRDSSKDSRNYRKSYDRRDSRRSRSRSRGRSRDRYRYRSRSRSSRRSPGHRRHRRY